MANQPLKFKPVFKNILESPFGPAVWEDVPAQFASSIFDIVNTFIQESFNKKVVSEKAEGQKEPGNAKIEVSENEGNDGQSQSQNWQTRSVVVGFNNVTKALEQQAKAQRLHSYPIKSALNKSNKPQEGSNPLTQNPDDNIVMVFVCKEDIRSELAVAHFPTLCGIANVQRLTALPKGSSNLLTKSYRQDSDNDVTLSTPESNKKRKADAISDDNNKSKSKSRDIEVTVIAFRKSALEFPLINSLLTMLKDNNIGTVKVPEIIVNLMKMEDERNALQIKKPALYKKTNIVSLKTTTPIINKKQDLKKQKISTGSQQSLAKSTKPQEPPKKKQKSGN